MLFGVYYWFFAIKMRKRYLEIKLRYYFDSLWGWSEPIYLYRIFCLALVHKYEII